MNLKIKYANIQCSFQVHGSHQSGIAKCLKEMLHEGGVTSLWRGNGINVIKIAPESALKFMAYEQAKKLIRRRRSVKADLSILDRFMAGSAAGAFSQSAIYPLEVRDHREYVIFMYNITYLWHGQRRAVLCLDTESSTV